MRKPKFYAVLIIIFSFIVPANSFARQGYSGYEGGIAAQQPAYGAKATKINYNYQEVCFLTGKPIIFKGTLTVTKKMNKGSITSTYSYNKLTNLDYSATLTRTLEYTSTISESENGQTIETTILSKPPKETIKIDKNTYTLQDYNFTKTSLTDNKPAINYYAGNLHSTKTFTYVVASDTGATGANAVTGKITVEETGEFYGYDQYWGTTEVQSLNYVLQNEQKSGTAVDKWGGTANVTLSNTTTKQLKYIENQPNQISFSGGYIQSVHDDSSLEYHSQLPKFDAKGVATDGIVEVSNGIRLETFPTESRLPVPNMGQLKGHWAEEDIRQLYSLEVFKGNDNLFNPEQYISRAEFAAALSRVAREVPADPTLAIKTTASRSKAMMPISPFIDVSIENLYFSQIDNVNKRKIMVGTSFNKFSPTNPMMLTDAVTTFIKALGLESLAPDPAPVTNFRDNDKIPSYAKKAVFVAEKIGLISPDEKGNFNPRQKLTKGKAAQLLNSLVNYMRDGIRSDYRENILNYSK